MGNGFFVTGTDTNVGKTVLSALLCAALPAAYWKPIQTGAKEGTDRTTVISLTGMAETNAFAEAYIFDDPVSPHLAALRTGREIRLEGITIPQAGLSQTLVVEGAGGCMVPINSHQFMTDLMVRLALPVILAARSTLGTINHTLLSLSCLRAAKVDVLGVVLIGPENQDNHEAVERYGKVRVIGRIPPLEGIDRQSLLNVFAANFAMGAFA